MNFSQQNQQTHPISAAAKAAFPYSAPMIAG
ncbi:MAG: branched-chain amino acid transporter AzlC, partial [Haemophilus seminalis]